MFFDHQQKIGNAGDKKYRHDHGYNKLPTVHGAGINKLLQDCKNIQLLSFLN